MVSTLITPTVKAITEEINTCSGVWQGFISGNWNQEIDVRDFIQKNYTLYSGKETFLSSPTDSTIKLWNLVGELIKEERKKRYFRYRYQSTI